MKSHYRLDELPTRKAHIVETLLLGAVITLLVSRRLLQAVRERLRRTAYKMPEQRWAAIFAAAAPAILDIVVLPPQVSKVIARRLEPMLLHEGPPTRIARANSSSNASNPAPLGRSSTQVSPLTDHGCVPRRFTSARTGGGSVFGTRSANPRPRSPSSFVAAISSPRFRRGVGEVWTAARAVHSEREVFERMRAGVGAAEPFVRGPIEERSLEGLTEGQREARRGSSSKAVTARSACRANAGTGKTVMLRRAAALAKGRRMVGLAPSASTARTLARETGLGCRTLQWFLAHCREVADGVADAKTLRKRKNEHGGALLVVDEMSLAGTAQARALLRIADRVGVARLVLVGDIRQLRGVEAGQPFRQLQLAGMATALLDDVQRQRDPNLKAAVLDMIEGAPAESLAQTAARLRLRLSPEARAGTALVAPTRALRAEIDDAVREGLEAEGVLRGGALEIETVVPLALTRAPKGDARNWREGDVALFQAYDSA